MKNHLICLPVLALLAWGGCKPCEDWQNPECPNYDPCLEQTPVSAEFRIIEDGSFGAAYQVRDTVYYDTLRAVQVITEAIHQLPGWTYTWRIGSETYEGPRAALDYSDAPKNTPIPLTLMVEGPPNTACFPEDDGRDTLVRTVIFRDYELSSFFLGKFHGYLNGNPEDTITLGFLNDWTMYNFKKGCSGGYWTGAGTFRSLLFVTGSNYICDRPAGLMVRDPEKTGDFERVRCTYSLTPRDRDPIPMLFEGRRVR